MITKFHVKEILPITYYYNDIEIIDNLECNKNFYNGVSEYLKENRDISFIENSISNYKKISINEKIEANNIISDNINYFKYSILSKEGKQIIEKWRNKYNYLFNKYNCVFELSAGLDSRVLLSFLINNNKTFYIKNFHRDTVYQKVNDEYDIEFIDFICSKYKNIKKEPPPFDFYFVVGGHFSEWFRDIRVFKNKNFIKYVYLCRKNGTFYPMIDKELLQINPLIPDLINTFILNKYCPELLEYKFQSGAKIYEKNNLPLKILKG